MRIRRRKAKSEPFLTPSRADRKKIRKYYASHPEKAKETGYHPTSEKRRKKRTPARKRGLRQQNPNEKSGRVRIIVAHGQPILSHESCAESPVTARTTTMPSRSARQNQPPSDRRDLDARDPATGGMNAR